MTSFYMFRMMYLTFGSQPRMSHEVEHHIHESPKSMTVPLIILAIGSIGAGWLGIPHALGGANRFEAFLEPVFSGEARQFRAEAETAQLAAGEKEKEEPAQPIEYLLMVASVGAGLAGWSLAKRAYSRAREGYKEPIRQATPAFYNCLYNKWYVDEAYDYLFTGRRKVGGQLRLGAMGLGDALWAVDAKVVDGGVNGAGWMTRTVGWLSVQWDKYVIDGILVNGLAVLSKLFSVQVRLLQWGLVQWYALVMVLGLAGFTVYYLVTLGH